MLNFNLLNPVLLSIAAAYKKQLIKYKVMLKLTYKQKEYTEKYEMDSLKSILEARQKLIKELEELNQGVLPLRDEVMKVLGLKDFSSKAILEAVPTPAARELAHIINKLADVLYSIKEMDRYNEELLRNKLKSVNNRLNSVQNKNKAIEAYNKLKSKKSGL